MTAPAPGLLDGVEILEVLSSGAAPTCRRAAAMAGQVAAQLGAVVHTSGADDLPPGRFHQLGKRAASHAQLADPAGWARVGGGRILLLADVPGGSPELVGAHELNVVQVVAEPWHNEATLFAASGLADLFGEPDGAPLVPRGEWGSATAAYAVGAALAAAQALALRGDTDVATVDCVDALRWVNWKAPAMAWAGAPITREGSNAEWPVLPCADGDVAFVFTDRDWKTIVDMVGDDRLTDERFARYKRRKEHRREYLAILAEWTSTKSKSELDELFHRWKIPASSVLTPTDLIADPTLVHRAAFRTHVVDGVAVPAPVAPIRVDAKRGGEARPMSADSAALPLDGVRVLDLGVLTAGAGTSSLLSDVGAEVIKIEASVKPDMFRFWAGADDSPLFHFSNRSTSSASTSTSRSRTSRADVPRAGRPGPTPSSRTSGVGCSNGSNSASTPCASANPSHRARVRCPGRVWTGPRADHTTFGSTLEAAVGLLGARPSEPTVVPTISGAEPELPRPDRLPVRRCGDRRPPSPGAEPPATAFHLDISQRDVAVHCLPARSSNRRRRGPSQPTWSGPTHRSADGRLGRHRGR